MPALLEPLLTWFKSWLLALHPASLFFLSFIEAIFFPLPPDVLLLPLSVLRPQMAPLFGVVATAGSVAGAAVGYLLGKWGGRPLLERVSSPVRVRQVQDLFHRYDVWAIGIAGFTPIPYKLFAVSAGVFLISFQRFFLASVVSRGARFMLEALLVMAYGEPVIDFIGRYFGWLTLALAALLLAGYWLYTSRRSPSRPAR